MTSTYTPDLTVAKHPMLQALAENWWLFMARGVCAIVFGVLAFIWPGATLLTLILLYGAFALVDGAAAIIAAIRGSSTGPRWWLAILGALGIAAGLLTLYWPGITAIVLLFLIATWAIATGVMQIIGAIKLRAEIDNEWLLIAGGVLSVLFGLMLLARPSGGALAMILVIGMYAIAQGVLTVALALRLRRHAQSAHRA